MRIQNGTRGFAAAALLCALVMADTSRTSAATKVTLPPAPFSYYALGDSITEGRQAKVHYPKLIAAAIGADTVVNLGTNAETAQGAVTDELPRVVAPCGVATVYIGLNDAHFIMLKRETPADFTAAISTIVSTLRSRCSVVAIATIAHNANAFALRYGPEYDRLIDNENAQIAAFTTLPGVVVVALDADPAMHDIANYNTTPVGLYFVHPNTAGAEQIALDFETALSK